LEGFVGLFLGRGERRAGGQGQQKQGQFHDDSIISLCATRVGRNRTTRHEENTRNPAKSFNYFPARRKSLCFLTLRTGARLSSLGVVSALCADSFEPPACAMLRRGKQARRYSTGSRSDRPKNH
jgi:hypothetical protein